MRCESAFRLLFWGNRKSVRTWIYLNTCHDRAKELDFFLENVYDIMDRTMCDYMSTKWGNCVLKRMRVVGMVSLVKVTRNYWIVLEKGGESMTILWEKVAEKRKIVGIVRAWKIEKHLKSKRCRKHELWRNSKLVRNRKVSDSKISR